MMKKITLLFLFLLTVSFGYSQTNLATYSFDDAASMTRDEVKFNNFINRLRANFKELIVKPLKLQMLVEFPELKNDEIISK